MIQSKEDLKYYIESDLRSLQCYPITLKMRVGEAVRKLSSQKLSENTEQRRSTL